MSLLVCSTSLSLLILSSVNYYLWELGMWMKTLERERIDKGKINIEMSLKLQSFSPCGYFRLSQTCFSLSERAHALHGHFFSSLEYLILPVWYFDTRSSTTVSFRAALLAWKTFCCLMWHLVVSALQRMLVTWCVPAQSDLVASRCGGCSAFSVSSSVTNTDMSR